MKKALYMSPVVFDGEKHEYTLYGNKLQGVTPIVGWLYPDTYAGIPQGVLDAAKDYGTMIHTKCELADGIGVVDHPSVKDYMDLKDERGLKTLVNEYLVSDEHRIASKIDVVFDDDSIADIKTTSSVKVKNVTVQLSIYAWLYEQQNKGRQVGKLFVIWLPKPQYGKSELLEVKRVPSDICQAIVESYLNGDSNEQSLLLLERFDGELFKVEKQMERKVSDIPASLRGAVDELMQVEQAKKEVEQREKELKAVIMQAMQQSGDNKYEDDLIQIIRKAGGVRQTVDSTKLKAEHPDIYAECLKESKTSESLQIKLF